MLFPISSALEVHVSGVSEDSGLLWDDHRVPADNATFDLLRSLPVQDFSTSGYA